MPDDSKQSTNTNTAGTLAIAILFGLLSLALPWAEIQVQSSSDPVGQLLVGSTVRLTGTNGTVGVAGVSLPTWFLCVLATAVPSIVLAKRLGRLGLTRGAVRVGAAAAALTVDAGVVLLLAGGSIKMGAVLAALAASVGAVTSFVALDPPERG